MVVDPSTLDLPLTALFAGWAMTDEVQRRLAERGFGELRLNDGVVIQHVLAAPLSITALAERLGVTQQAASKAVADLERRGLLRRAADPSDARTKLLHLTEHAQAAVEATRVLRQDLQEEIESKYGAGRVEDARNLLAAVIGRYGGDDAIRARRVRPPR
ncbi:MarR family winged helix-turn-helix transcriptional regulator [Amycolatopsis sp.]|uniref:MarR family winged helix-turn-helix transcriptional regulator n=1 Tax=Amycolatopsis sp. TaxID=37632 RepID=UPI002D7E4F2D|nr:MarR family transcriptional regulator [Amycolatopsis sp.]HET6707006.1 MarR family transcriptional regulator [Amycolatopsis sp.]